MFLISNCFERDLSLILSSCNITQSFLQVVKMCPLDFMCKKVETNTLHYKCSYYFSVFLRKQKIVISCFLRCRTSATTKGQLNACAIACIPIAACWLQQHFSLSSRAMLDTRETPSVLKRTKIAHFCFNGRVQFIS